MARWTVVYTERGGCYQWHVFKAATRWVDYVRIEDVIKAFTGVLARNSTTAVSHAKGIYYGNS